jgi:protein-disulfide isomerase-like protein with CxxC motif
VSAVTIRYFTDPSADTGEERRLRLAWLYGDQIAWETCMVVVREETIHACRAVVGTRLRWPDRELEMLRRLQALARAGEPLDLSDTLELAAGQAGLPVRELAAYCAEPEVEAALRADMDAARGRACPSFEVRGALEELERRPDPSSAEEVVAWAGTPLTAAEIAAVRATP